jgi:hypothetical protein
VPYPNPKVRDDCIKPIFEAKITDSFDKLANAERVRILSEITAKSPTKTAHPSPAQQAIPSPPSSTIPGKPRNNALTP